MTRAELSARFPHWTIRQDPDPDCHACKGGGVLTIPPTRIRSKPRSQPCFCAVSSEPHSEGKRDFMREVGKAAGRVKREMGL